MQKLQFDPAPLSRAAGPRRLVFETHATSLDNEAGLASGHVDVDLSPEGEQQARALGSRYQGEPPSLALTSDLRRAWRTAVLAFGDRVPIARDARLRECDYGALTRAPREQVAAARSAAIDTAFPGGESYVEVAARVRACLEDLRRGWPGGWVLIVGHHATHCALEHLLRGVSLADAVTAPVQWQPGWSYTLEGDTTG